MTNKDVKKRDVLDYKTFIKAYETAMKVVELKKGQNANPGAHAIEGNDLYVRNDANPYQAMGIPHDKKLANINNLNNANQVDVSGENPNEDPTKKEIKAAQDASDIVIKAASNVADL